MRLARFTAGGRTLLGKLAGDDVIDLPGVSPAIPNDMIELLRGGGPLLALVESR
jgi:hypothetical protein